MADADAVAKKAAIEALLFSPTPSEEQALSPTVGDKGLYALHVRRSDTLYTCDTRVLREVKDGSARHLVPLALPSASASRAPSAAPF